MEKLLSDMVLLSEIGDLAAEAGTIADSEQLTEDKTAKKDALANVQTKGKKARAAFGLKGITGEDPSSEDDKEQSEEKSESLGSGRGLPRSPSGSVLLKHLLERWEEPVDNNRVGLCRCQADCA